YSKDSCIALTAFVDADHAGCQDTRKSPKGQDGGVVRVVEEAALRGGERVLFSTAEWLAEGTEEFIGGISGRICHGVRVGLRGWS
ncbi:hypothetical protein Tco_1205871, partial [Tanacetum coccineum]